MHLIAPIFILLNLSFYSGNCLLDMLNSDAWQSRVKALIVISKLIQSSSFDKVSIIINHLCVLKLLSYFKYDSLIITHNLLNRIQIILIGG
jgi:hypothetical protein